MTRREFLAAGSAIAAVGLIKPAHAAGLLAEQRDDPEYSLPFLPYDYNALEPHIDTLTMTIHHDKHHAAYVANLNTALKDHPELRAKKLVDLMSNLDAVPEGIRTAVRNNGGGHLNHRMFWKWLSPKGGSPSGALATAIDRDFGSLDGFKDQFTKAATGRFGSGWAFLVQGNDGKLSAISLPNQDNPIMTGGKLPLLGLDVWEHAYYLKYHNVRADYVKAFWNIVNWDQVASAFVG